MISIAHIHPMLVHFPIVLLFIAVALDMALLLSKKNLVDRKCLQSLALSALLLGTLSAIAAAVFGDFALDAAISKGFPSGPLEIHEEMALITIAIFCFDCLLRLLAVWRRYALQGFIGWISALPGIVGLFLLVTTAYYGGELVYYFGVNVAPVIP
jgi:uncharacterized membrane protein